MLHLKFNASKDRPFVRLAKDGFFDGYAGEPTLDKSTWVGDMSGKMGWLQSQSPRQEKLFSLLVQFGARDLHLLGAEFTVDFHEGAKLFGRVSYRLKTQSL